jgi:hypothetical protein
MTNQGVNFQLPSGGQFSAAVDRVGDAGDRLTVGDAAVHISRLAT